MADIINLRTARKNIKRAQAEKQAEQNRAKFGQSKVDKKLNEATKILAEKKLDSHQRES
jgi:Domain of unknown function (DUF4169)